MSASARLEPYRHLYPQAWLLLISLMASGTYVAWDNAFFSIVLALDRSYMVSLTLGLVMVATAHCGWHVAHFSSRIAQLQDWLDHQGSAQAGRSAFLRAYLDDLDMTRSTGTASHDDDGVVDIHAERIRSQADLGWFFVDLAVRLGLLGTIIGFILIFASLTDVNIQGGDDLKDLLIAMSGGMGTALLTTLTGLVAASLLSFQYLILGRETEHLVGLLLRVHRMHHGLPDRGTRPAGP